MALQFKVGNGEFGEVYHLLATAYLLQRVKQEIAICFKNFPAGEELFRFLSVNTVAYNPAAKPKPLPSTADILLKYFSSGCLENLATIIREAAQDKGWPFPHTELATQDSKLVIWQREGTYRPHRNSSKHLVEQLVDLCSRHGTIPVVFGTRCGLSGAIELGEFYKTPFFTAEDSIPKQLWFFDMLFRSYGAIAHVGMMSGAMDGPAMLFGHKTVFLARHCDATPRMQKVSRAVPNLIWQQIDYDETFQKLTDAQLQKLEQNLWG